MKRFFCVLAVGMVTVTASPAGADEPIQYTLKQGAISEQLHALKNSIEGAVWKPGIKNKVQAAWQEAERFFLGYNREKLQERACHASDTADTLARCLQAGDTLRITTIVVPDTKDEDDGLPENIKFEGETRVAQRFRVEPSAEIVVEELPARHTASAPVPRLKPRRTDAPVPSLRPRTPLPDLVVAAHTVALPRFAKHPNGERFELFGEVPQRAGRLTFDAKLKATAFIEIDEVAGAEPTNLIRSLPRHKLERAATNLGMLALQLGRERETLLGRLEALQGELASLKRQVITLTAGKEA